MPDMTRAARLALLVALAGAGCRTAVTESHRHGGDVSGSWLKENPNEGFALVEVPGLPDERELDERAISPDGRFQAFATCEPGCRVLVQSIHQGEVHELQGPLFSDLRPFSRLVWHSSDILLFDQWAQPHYGIHYTVDVRNRRLLQAAPITDNEDGP
jgi:hypothetical protein